MNMIHPIRISNTDASIGISPFELTQEWVPTRWMRIKIWVGMWLRRLLPFLFLLVVLRGEDLNPKIPDSLQIRYWQARAELAQVIQEMVVACHGDVGIAADGKSLGCVIHSVVDPNAQPEKPAKEDKK